MMKDDDTNLDAVAESIDKMYQDMTAKLLESPMMNPSAGMTRGRKAALTRAEAKAVREDMRPYAEIAASFGISKDTIMRVKGTGRFKGVPYIPSDVDPAEYGFRPGMKNYLPEKPGVKGRPFKSGRPPLTDAEKAAMHIDLRPADIVAAEFKVPVDYVRRYRKAHKISAGRFSGVPEDIKVLIAVDPRPDWILAREYRMPVFIIERIKERYGHLSSEVTSGGNNDEEDSRGV